MTGSPEHGAVATQHHGQIRVGRPSSASRPGKGLAAGPLMATATFTPCSRRVFGATAAWRWAAWLPARRISQTR